MENESLINKLKRSKRISMESIESGTTPELPHVLNKWFVELLEDVEKRNPQELKVGEEFLKLYSGRYIEYHEHGYDIGRPKAMIEAWDAPAKMAKSVTQDSISIRTATNDTWAIYTIINPSKCTKMIWGYKSPCWQPEVKADDGKWREASPDECESWSKLKESERRVIYCIGVLGDDDEDE